MPRTPRSLTLEVGLPFHKTWKAHNNEFNLQTPVEKNFYLVKLCKGIVKINSDLLALCLMDNHAHEIYHLHDDLEHFSNFMRSHHSAYGAFFNRLHRRSGKVAKDRPHTSLIQNDQYLMTATFYIHANPIRAGMIKDAKDYIYSTHNLYAFGKVPSWLKGIQFSWPQWYLNLGHSMKLRQRRYRQLFDEYLRQFGLIKQNFSTFGFGETLWTMKRRRSILNACQQNAQSPP